MAGFGGLNLGDVLKLAQNNPLTQTQEESSLFGSVAKAILQSDEPKDLGELWEMQKKNLALLADQNSSMSAKMTKLAAQQMEVFQEAYKTYEHYTKKAERGEAVDKGAMQTAQDAMLKAMGNMQALGQKNAEVTEENAEKMEKSMSDSVSELQSLLKKFAG